MDYSKNQTKIKFFNDFTENKLYFISLYAKSLVFPEQQMILFYLKKNKTALIIVN